MNGKVQEATQKLASGYNCAQAIVCTYCKELGISEAEAYRMAEAFGSGMAIQSTCGALTGALMLVGLKNSGGEDQLGKTKGSTYKVAKSITQDFEEKVGSLICKEIKSKPVKCSCAECVAHACEIVEEKLL